MNQEKKIYSITEAAEILGVKPHKIDYLFYSGRLNRKQFSTIGGQRIFYPEDLETIRNALADVAYKS